jgi:beta-glucosidase
MTDINELVKKMSLEEKAALCIGATAWTTTAIARLGLPELTVSDGPHGVRHAADVENPASPSLPATCFPTASCTASTWDVELIHTMGQALAEECIALKVDLVLGPGANMKRSPLGGRNFEYFSEDPYLAGQMAANFINGVQSKGVGTSLKHFAANNQEFERLTMSSEVDERTLREIYLAAFETAVKQGKPWSVMCAYNKLNGTFCSENHWLLVDVLKEEWGFEGFVVSDWGAVHDRVASLKGGLDLEMPGPRTRRVKNVVDAVRSGDLDEALLDESVRRILRIVFKGAGTPKRGTFDNAAHHNLARRIAAEGMVLLKNNGLLPLKDQGHIAVIGRAAETAHFQGGGSSHINPTRVDNPLKELQELAGKAEVTYAEGYPLDGDQFDQALIDSAVESARLANVALLYLALPESKESEGYDRADLDLTAQQIALIKAVSAAQPKTVVILNNGAPLVMGEWIDGPAAVLEAWMMGQAGGGAIADVLFGRVNPCGRLAETFPLRLVDTPPYLNFPGGSGKVRYGEGLFIGYRYYDAKQVPVQFPFGYGLSYTSFTYQNARTSASSFKDVDGLTVSVDITNTGQLAGKEVVQVYVHDVRSKLIRPLKELKGFAKVALQPGETKTVSVNLDFRAFAYYHPAYRQWITEDGDFDILIGASSADIRQSLPVTLNSTLSLPCILSRESSSNDWLADPAGRPVFEPLFQQIMASLRSAFHGNQAEASELGQGFLEYLMSLPLPDFLYFHEKSLPMAPEEMVDGLLAQVGITK